MEQRLAAFHANVSMPERVKFTAPLLLLHGLWTGGWIWEEVAWALSQRGWECWAPDLLRGRDHHTLGQIRLADYVSDVVAAAGGLWAPPVVCGHDLGSLLALSAAARIQPRAMVLIVPLLPRAWIAGLRPPLPLMRLSVLPALLWSRPLLPPRQRIAQEFLFAALPQDTQTRLQAKLKPDSGTLARTLTRGQVAFPANISGCPILVVSGRADRMSPPAVSWWLTKRLQAEHREYPDSGHWPLIGDAALVLAGDMHRWLIKTLGEALLVPAEDEGDA